MKSSGLIAIILLCFFSFSGSLRAQTVDLIWQGDGYTPPFYEGKSLWPYQGTLTLLAVPQGLGDPSKLSYRWSVDGTVEGDMSGTGKSSFIYSGDPLGQGHEFKVEVTSYDDYQAPILAQNTVDLSETAPSLAIYENSPLYGILFNKELSGGFSLQGQEETLTAFPFNFSAKSALSPQLSYRWLANGSQSSDGNTVTYRAPDSSAGTSNVSLSVLSSSRVLQSANAALQIRFGDQNAQ